MTSPGAQNTISLSVALVTCNRPESLRRCLESWRRQTARPDEIIVSDDSDQSVAPQIEEIAESFGCRYSRGPGRGLYANRNHAALQARGTHILTGDDDHTHPADYVEKILEVVSCDPERIWIFSERSPRLPAGAPLPCPPELHRSGLGCTPKDPSDCAAIADGSSVFPRKVFDSGLRYDETYRFGGLWYLWGKVLVKSGFRISFSDKTFVWHHEDIESRLDDVKAVQDQLACTTYVQFVNALFVDPSAVNLFWACAYLIKRILTPDGVGWFRVKARLSLPGVITVFKQVLAYPGRSARSGGLPIRQ